MKTLAEMNNSATVLYSGLEDRMKVVANATTAIEKPASDARRVSEDMRELALAAKRIEALVERLDEYTHALEDRLSHSPL